MRIAFHHNVYIRLFLLLARSSDFNGMSTLVLCYYKSDQSRIYYSFDTAFAPKTRSFAFDPIIPFSFRMCIHLEKRKRKADGG